MEIKKGQTLILVDKPKGITSFDVIRILRKKLNIRKMGHSGTLDPNASGLMLIGLGGGTKQLSQFIGLPKTYEAEILLGKKTDSGDITGKVIEEKSVPTLTKLEVEKLIAAMVGEHTLEVPMYSAIKKDGKPLYKYARSGEVVEVPQKTMKILSANLQSLQGETLQVFFEVSSGTYIRTLAELLAKRLGTVGTIVNLRRLSIGNYDIKDAMVID